MTQPVAYLALDPGDTTGWAEFDDAGEPVGYGQVVEAELTQFLTEHISNNLDLKAVICENFLLYGHKAMAQTNGRARKMGTSKKIGKIELICELRGVPVILQPASNKPIGYMWAGLQPPSNHGISHQFDAVAHGVYYLQNNGIKKPSLRKDV